MIEEYAREEADLLYHLNLGPSRRDDWHEQESERSDSAADRTMPKLSFEYIDQAIRNDDGGTTVHLAQASQSNELRVEVANR